MTDIIPAILSQNLNVIRERLDQVFGLAKKIQIDLVDGNYVPVKTWPFNGDQFQEVREMVRGEERFPHISDFILEIDMMVLHPIEYLSDFISLGAKSFVIHIDSTDHVDECLDAIKNSGCQAGLGIKPAGDISILESFLPSVNFVQFMGNDRVGHSGVDLDEKVLEKIKNFHERHPSFPIQIDIGVNELTISRLKNAGVFSFVSGSSIFNSPNVRETLIKFQSL